VIDRVVQVKDEDAKSTTRELAKKEGIFAGISSGAAVFAALEIAKELGADKSVVVILPDFGERYMSTDLFSEGPV
jgi:cysteine synthase A